jgi:hypothetical protein
MAVVATEHDNTQHLIVLHGCSVSEMDVWTSLHRLSIVFATVSCDVSQQEHRAGGRNGYACVYSGPGYSRVPGCVVHAIACVFRPVLVHSG